MAADIVERLQLSLSVTIITQQGMFVVQSRMMSCHIGLAALPLACLAIWNHVDASDGEIELRERLGGGSVAAAVAGLSGAAAGLYLAMASPEEVERQINQAIHELTVMPKEDADIATMLGFLD
ncbi:hypothetical protein BGZ99_000220 [Dissophora globulifera]|uniref:Uncharacterized protein n=1 Tax=Dissophora globulifera TaxID=979702 RepID=A0A9P6UKM6_9FUNG|nr:hypothetical protein BGZ99_000220 [Dissophora globulifera]